MTSRRARGALLALAILSMAHVGSPDTFFSGHAGPYPVRVSVRLPGVIPGRAQVAVRIVGATTATGYQVSLRAGQWDVGLKGAPPPEIATPVPGDPSLHAAELWFMTATSYQLAIAVDGPAGAGTVVVPVLALATAERTMAPWLGAVLGALALFLSVGLLTIIGAAVRESVLSPGLEPDRVRTRNARIGIVVTAGLAGLILWGGSRWWTAEANAYGRSILYRPFAAGTSLGESQRLTLSIRDPRWTGDPNPRSRFNALLPDHGKLMHLFLVREGSLDGLAHLHPVARTPEALDFDTTAPPLPAGRYRVYGDIVHESGYAQTLVASVDLPAPAAAPPPPADPDDSWSAGQASPEASTASVDIGNGAQLVWRRGDASLSVGEERTLDFAVRDAAGAAIDVEPYMGMAAHVIVASRDGSVFAHLHPSGSISMAAWQRFSDAPAKIDPHVGHAMPVSSEVAVPFAFPKAGAYRVWVQVKRGGAIKTAAFDVEARSKS